MQYVQCYESAIGDRATMVASWIMPRCDYRPYLATGFIPKEAFSLTMKHHPIIFAMAAEVPTVAMTSDDYYHHKNFGAMKFFSQHDFLIKGEPEHLEQQVVGRPKLAASCFDEISSELKKVVGNLRKSSGEVISRFVGERFAEKDSQG